MSMCRIENNLVVYINCLNLILYLYLFFIYAETVINSKYNNTFIKSISFLLFSVLYIVTLHIHIFDNTGFKI